MSEAGWKIHSRSLWENALKGKFGMFTKAGNRKVAAMVKKTRVAMSEASDEDLAVFLREEMDKIEKKHPEVTDTVVREAIAVAVERDLLLLR